MKILVTMKGGAGSGNWGHAGRPGLVGGSGSGIGGIPVGSVVACSKTEYANKVRDDYGGLIAENAKRYDMSVEEYTKEANSVLGKILAKSSVAVRVTEGTLRHVLEDGKFKTQHETGTSSGSYDPELRGEFEKSVLGISEGEDPPVYGYITQRTDGRLGSPEESLYLDQYGKVAVYLKSDVVQNRTTFTNCDSMDSSGYLHEAPRLHPSPIADPSIYSMFQTSQGVDVLGVVQDVAKWGSRKLGAGPDTGVYWEAQIHGSVQVSAIDKVVFASRPDASTISALEAQNIPWLVI